MHKSDLQEQLAALYLRLNGYFATGFIVHAPEGEFNNRGEPRRNRSEIDTLAIRFPHNSEPEREIGVSEYLQTSTTCTDILICEVKGQNQPLKFNPGVRENPESIRSIMKWIGLFTDQELEELITPVQNMLSTRYPVSRDRFRELTTPGNIRIRAILFAPDRAEPTAQQGRYIHGQEIINYIWSCLRPMEPRLGCQTRYDFGLWGMYEDIIRFFKDRDREKPNNIQEVYQALLDE